jgi:hypothetical protein
MCGLLGLRSLIVRAPLRVPVFEGLKTTETVHWPPAGTLAAQVLLVTLKSPLVAMLPIAKASVAVLILLKVTL